MFSLEPSLEVLDASENLCKLITCDINSDQFSGALQSLQCCFDSYTTTCPAPFIASGLIITPEIRRQCELYLPIADISRTFNRLYSFALNYSPILSSTPFHNTFSWVDTFVGLAPHLRFTSNPALLLKTILGNQELLTEFLFSSFLPRRFYGVFSRYPKQRVFLLEWLKQQKTTIFRCLDAACGTGEESYGLARLLIEHGFYRAGVRIEGWTIEPLEVWSAAHCSFPHDRKREALFRNETSSLFECGFHKHIRFCCADLTHPSSAKQFNLIICNGLLGGPILHKNRAVEKVVANLSEMLTPDGIVLAADNFHSGWKQQCPQHMLRTLFEANGLQTFEAGEGFGALKKHFRT